MSSTPPERHSTTGNSCQGDQGDDDQIRSSCLNNIFDVLKDMEVSFPIGNVISDGTMSSPSVMSARIGDVGDYPLSTVSQLSNTTTVASDLTTSDILSVSPNRIYSDSPTTSGGVTEENKYLSGAWMESQLGTIVQSISQYKTSNQNEASGESSDIVETGRSIIEKLYEDPRAHSLDSLLRLYDVCVSLYDVSYGAKDSIEPLELRIREELSASLPSGGTGQQGKSDVSNIDSGHIEQNMGTIESNEAGSGQGSEMQIEDHKDKGESVGLQEFAIDGEQNIQEKTIAQDIPNVANQAETKNSQMIDLLDHEEEKSEESQSTKSFQDNETTDKNIIDTEESLPRDTDHRVLRSISGLKSSSSLLDRTEQEREIGPSSPHPISFSLNVKQSSTTEDEYSVDRPSTSECLARDTRADEPDTTTILKAPRLVESIFGERGKTENPLVTRIFIDDSDALDVADNHKTQSHIQSPTGQIGFQSNGEVQDALSTAKRSKPFESNTGNERFLVTPEHTRILQHEALHGPSELSSVTIFLSRSSSECVPGPEDSEEKREKSSKKEDSPDSLEKGVSESYGNDSSGNSSSSSSYENKTQSDEYETTTQMADGTTSRNIPLLAAVRDRLDLNITIAESSADEHLGEDTATSGNKYQMMNDEDSRITGSERSEFTEWDVSLSEEDNQFVVIPLARSAQQQPPRPPSRSHSRTKRGSASERCDVLEKTKTARKGGRQVGESKDSESSSSITPFSSFSSTVDHSKRGVHSISPHSEGSSSGFSGISELSNDKLSRPRELSRPLQISAMFQEQLSKNRRVQGWLTVKDVDPVHKFTKAINQSRETLKPLLDVGFINKSIVDWFTTDAADAGNFGAYQIDQDMWYQSNVVPIKKLMDDLNSFVSVDPSLDDDVGASPLFIYSYAHAVLHLRVSVKSESTVITSDLSIQDDPIFVVLADTLTNLNENNLIGPKSILDLLPILASGLWSTGSMEKILYKLAVFPIVFYILCSAVTNSPFLSLTVFDRLPGLIEAVYKLVSSMSETFPNIGMFSVKIELADGKTVERGIPSRSSSAESPTSPQNIVPGSPVVCVSDGSDNDSFFPLLSLVRYVCSITTALLIGLIFELNVKSDIHSKSCLKVLKHVLQDSFAKTPPALGQSDYCYMVDPYALSCYGLIKEGVCPFRGVELDLVLDETDTDGSKTPLTWSFASGVITMSKQATKGVPGVLIGEGNKDKEKDTKKKAKEKTSKRGSTGKAHTSDPVPTRRRNVGSRSFTNIFTVLDIGGPDTTSSTTGNRTNNQRRSLGIRVKQRVEESATTIPFFHPVKFQLNILRARATGMFEPTLENLIIILQTAAHNRLALVDHLLAAIDFCSERERVLVVDVVVRLISRIMAFEGRDMINPSGLDGTFTEQNSEVSGFSSFSSLSTKESTEAFGRRIGGGRSELHSELSSVQSNLAPQQIGTPKHGAGRAVGSTTRSKNSIGSTTIGTCSSGGLGGVLDPESVDMLVKILRHYPLMDMLQTSVLYLIKYRDYRRVLSLLGFLLDVSSTLVGHNTSFNVEQIQSFTVVNLVKVLTSLNVSSNYYGVLSSAVGRGRGRMISVFSPEICLHLIDFMKNRYQYSKVFKTLNLIINVMFVGSIDRADMGSSFFLPLALYLSKVINSSYLLSRTSEDKQQSQGHRRHAKNGILSIFANSSNAAQMSHRSTFGMAGNNISGINDGNSSSGVLTTTTGNTSSTYSYTPSTQQNVLVGLRSAVSNYMSKEKIFSQKNEQRLAKQLQLISKEDPDLLLLNDIIFDTDSIVKGEIDDNANRVNFISLALNTLSETEFNASSLYHPHFIKLINLFINLCLSFKKGNVYPNIGVIRDTSSVFKVFFYVYTLFMIKRRYGCAFLVIQSMLHSTPDKNLVISNVTLMDVYYYSCLALLKLCESSNYNDFGDSGVYFFKSQLQASIDEISLIGGTSHLKNFLIYVYRITKLQKVVGEDTLSAHTLKLIKHALSLSIDIGSHYEYRFKHMLAFFQLKLLLSKHKVVSNEPKKVILSNPDNLLSPFLQTYKYCGGVCDNDGGVVFTAEENTKMWLSILDSSSTGDSVLNHISALVSTAKAFYLINNMHASISYAVEALDSLDILFCNDTFPNVVACDRRLISELKDTLKNSIELMVLLDKVINNKEIIKDTPRTSFLVEYKEIASLLYRTEIVKKLTSRELTCFNDFKASIYLQLPRTGSCDNLSQQQQKDKQLRGEPKETKERSKPIYSATLTAGYVSSTSNLPTNTKVQAQQRQSEASKLSLYIGRENNNKRIMSSQSQFPLRTSTNTPTSSFSHSGPCSSRYNNNGNRIFNFDMDEITDSLAIGQGQGQSRQGKGGASTRGSTSGSAAQSRQQRCCLDPRLPILQVLPFLVAIARARSQIDDLVGCEIDSAPGVRNGGDAGTDKQAQHSSKPFLSNRFSRAIRCVKPQNMGEDDSKDTQGDNDGNNNRNEHVKRVTNVAKGLLKSYISQQGALRSSFANKEDNLDPPLKQDITGFDISNAPAINEAHKLRFCSTPVSILSALTSQSNRHTDNPRQREKWVTESKRRECQANKGSGNFLFAFEANGRVETIFINTDDNKYLPLGEWMSVTYDTNNLQDLLQSECTTTLTLATSTNVSSRIISTNIDLVRYLVALYSEQNSALYVYDVKSLKESAKEAKEAKDPKERRRSQRKDINFSNNIASIRPLNISYAEVAKGLSRLQDMFGGLTASPSNHIISAMESRQNNVYKIYGGEHRTKKTLDTLERAFIAKVDRMKGLSNSNNSSLSTNTQGAKDKIQSGPRRTPISKSSESLGQVRVFTSLKCLWFPFNSFSNVRRYNIGCGVDGNNNATNETFDKLSLSELVLETFSLDNSSSAASLGIPTNIAIQTPPSSLSYPPKLATPVSTVVTSPGMSTQEFGATVRSLALSKGVNRLCGCFLVKPNGNSDVLPPNSSGSDTVGRSTNLSMSSLPVQYPHCPESAVPRGANNIKQLEIGRPTMSSKSIYDSPYRRECQSVVKHLVGTYSFPVVVVSASDLVKQSDLLLYLLSQGERVRIILVPPLFMRPFIKYVSRVIKTARKAGVFKRNRPPTLINGVLKAVDEEMELEDVLHSVIKAFQKEFGVNVEML